MTRLDEMDFNEITIKYKEIFNNLLSVLLFDKIKLNIEGIYNEYISYVNKKYKVKGGTFGRGELKWGRNIIWGWYVESLLKEFLIKNEKIEKISFYGGDSSHKFLYNDQEKKIDIKGKKTVEPDFLIKLKNIDEFCVELKTAAVEVFSIKKGNIEQLYKETAYNDRITLIIMIDLENELYSIENLNYFNLAYPFINQRMEGQLCYNFPVPEKKINLLFKEDFNSYLDNDIFSIDKIKKLKALKKAEDIKDKIFIRIIKNKLRLEKYEEDKIFHMENFDNKISLIEERCPDISMTWEKIYSKLKI